MCLVAPVAGSWASIYPSVRHRYVRRKVSALTGKMVYGPERLTPGSYSASPVLADGKIYITSEDGVATVYRAGPKFEILAENKMDDYTLRSMAVKDGQIFLRTAGWLWAIGAQGGIK